MNEIELEQLDLNLLTTLRVLLDLASVTRAAERLGRTPSAVSHSLSRARAMFSDPLLVREGHTMRRTPRAQQLRARLRPLLNDIEALLRDPVQFEPRTTSRRFRLACPDLLAPVVPELLRALERKAPSASLDLLPQAIDPAAALTENRADLAVGAMPRHGHAIKVRALGQLSWCVLSRRGHPAGAKLSKREWMKWPHITVQTGSTSRSVVGDALAQAGLTRKIGLTVRQFLVAPHVVARTNMFFTGPAEILRRVASSLRLQLREPPIAIPKVPTAVMWAERLNADPSTVWFKNLVIEELQKALA